MSPPNAVGEKDEEKDREAPKVTSPNALKKKRRPFWSVFGDWRTEDHGEEFVLA